MIKLDFDRVTKRVSNFLLSCPKPFEVRQGNHGFHFRKDCLQGCNKEQNCYDCWVYGFDDKNRLKINITQKNNNLPNNVLWDIKRGKKKPGEWERIETTQEADRFLRKFTGFW